MPSSRVYQPPGYLLKNAPLEIVAMEFTRLEISSDRGIEDVLVLTDIFGDGYPYQRPNC